MDCESSTYAGYAGKSRTDSNLAWHRPQTAICRVEAELIKKSAQALQSTTDPLEKLRLLCLTRGACGILGLARVFRGTDGDRRKELNKDEFLADIQDTGLEFSDEDADNLFAQIDTDDNGYVSVDEFIRKIRPPMSDGRRAIVEKAFRKLDKAEHGVVASKDLRAMYSVNSNPSYNCGDETKELIINKFLANFESEDTVDGKITLEEFMNYYSGISVSIDNDCYFDLMMRQAYKL